MRIRLDKLSAYARHGYDLELSCRACGHKVVVTPEWFFARGIIGSVLAIERRLRCTACRARRTVISSTMSGPSGGRRRAASWQDDLRQPNDTDTNERT